MKNNNIPKTIHYCWFGGNPLPDIALKCIESWKKYFPDYEIKEWNESNFNINFNKYAKQAYDKKKYAFFTDVARLYIIYNYGGIYFDVDVEVIKKYDEILENCDAFFGLESDKCINTGLGFGSKKHNKIVKEMLDDYNNKTFIDNNGKCNLTACPIINSIILKKNNFKLNGEYEEINKIRIFPVDYFNPKGGYNLDVNITEYTYSIHHYDGTWLSIEEINRSNKYKKLKNKYGIKKANIIFNTIYIPYRIISKINENRKK